MVGKAGSGQGGQSGLLPGALPRRDARWAFQAGAAEKSGFGREGGAGETGEADLRDHTSSFTEENTFPKSILLKGKKN